MQRKVLEEIENERREQDAQWGGPSHDDAHDPFDWFDYIGQQCEKLGTAAIARGPSYAATPDFRRRFVKIGALCVAALESFDRKQLATGH